MGKEQVAFRFWWPQSTGGSLALSVLLIFAVLTIFLDPYFFWVNVVFWYFAGLIVRVVFVRMTSARSSHKPTD